jgi:hypothetical protein
MAAYVSAGMMECDAVKPLELTSHLLCHIFASAANPSAMSTARRAALQAGLPSLAAMPAMHRTGQRHALEVRAISTNGNAPMGTSTEYTGPPLLRLDTAAEGIAAVPDPAVAARRASSSAVSGTPC